MRLINCSTLELEEFFGSQIPPYSILSHTWETHEISHQDYYPLEELQQKKGSEKILKTCEVVLRHGHRYVWIDTCCIDKRSSAELTEAINSMYKWYSMAQRCYIYLSDHDSEDEISEFGRSRWFTRCWTLQEMIAPTYAYFFDKNWKYIGTKCQLSKAIMAVTGIDEATLTNFDDGVKISVARKMSWAAGRESTREEDQAYSLFGIFNVNLPLLYGEGPRAFTRLQEAIIKETNDLSLFAWQSDPRQETENQRGILARSPNEFARAGNIISGHLPIYNPEFTLTNIGLKIEANMRSGPGRFWFLPLNCYQEKQAAQIRVLYNFSIDH
ncbi:HET-domain-containing protein [Melanomma pulvis-pyrius CBS 109.77]|uniref:HET-domain-containing protein n=1 Tax=Melanomma pulvis-pyrius CBS 109.77 TaxID=1314802 RepID=A0A6A6WR31_9PLEO|nr:HET-domain-containing protein [Melanomma pulvis-pyrius CBS 109.77]